MRRRLALSLFLTATALGLAGCFYGPAYPGYDYGPYYEPGYFYGPPVFGSVVIGDGFHRFHRHW